MENTFTVSFRKYRPQTFESVVGQEHITETLKNAIINQKLAQAFLFCGPRGVGKTTCARILAKILNCDDPIAALKDGSYANTDSETNVNIFELDAASNSSVEDIRSLIEQVRFIPPKGKKIYIIDEVHMLSNSAFNAFLKTLEEPPPHAIFILATTEKHKIIPTILSRCQIFDFKRIRVSDIEKQLEMVCKNEGIAFESEGLNLIAQKCDGAMRDSLSMLDQLNSFTSGNLSYSNIVKSLNLLDHDYFFAATDCVLNSDMEGLLVLLHEILAKGFEALHFLVGLEEHFRNLLLVRMDKTANLLEVPDSLKARYTEQSKLADPNLLLSCLSISNRCEINYKSAKNQQVHIELAMMKMAQIQNMYHAAMDNDSKPSTPIALRKQSEAVGLKSSSTTPKPSNIPITEAHKYIEEKIEPKKTLKSGGFLKSIKAKNLTVEEIKSNIVSEPTENLNQNIEGNLTLDLALIKIGDDFTKTGMPVLAQIIKRGLNEIVGNKIIFKLLNNVELDIVESNRELIISLLRNLSSIKLIELDLIIDNNLKNEAPKLFSTKDKIQTLIDKNPELLNLIKEFDLESGF